MRSPFRKKAAKLQLEPFASKENLFLYLGEIGVRMLNKEISERSAELSLNAVSKYFTGVELYKSLQQSEKKDEPATKPELETVKTEVADLKKRFDNALDPKPSRGMWG